MKFLTVLKWLFSHRTKTLGFCGITVGVLATSDKIGPEFAGWLILANSLLTAWVGFFNSSQPAPSQEK